MVIHKLSLKNFKPFTDISFTLNSQFNIIIGKNMSGKTSILDGLSVAMGAFFSGISGVQERKIKYDEIHITTYKEHAEQQTPVVVKADGLVNNTTIEWTKEILGVDKNRTTHLGINKIKKITKNIDKSIEQNEDIILPILVYYPSGRAWYPLDEQDKELEHNGSRKLGYKSWSYPELSYKILLRWLKTMELGAIQEQLQETELLINQEQKNHSTNQRKKLEQSIQLKVIKSCILQCIEYAQDFYFDIKNGVIKLKWQGKGEIPLNYLSHGVKNMVSIIADIAYRCLRLNPHLGLEAAQKTEGIVLIDELDAHLHPSWQLTIVDNLKKTFPKIQFVVTTHSPLIIGSADVGELIILPDNLSQGSFQPEEKSYKGWQLQFILEQIMNSASNYDLNVLPIVSEIHRAYSEKNLKVYDEAFDKLKSLVNPSDTLIKMYEMRRTNLL